LMGILMPALAKVRQLAYRMVCGTNLSGIGKAMLLYSNDNFEEYPRAGGRNSVWSTSGIIRYWWQSTQNMAFFGKEIPDDGACANATVGSCFFLLIKYTDVTPKQFICKGDVKAKVFKLADYAGIGGENIRDITQAWDFAGWPSKHNSYAYHYPFNLGCPTPTGFPISTAANPASPICADRNPFLDEDAQEYLQDESVEMPEWVTDGGGYKDKDKKGNAAAHQQDGQNVLFNDNSVKFCRYPNVGVDNDNIYKCWFTASLETGDAGKKEREWGGFPEWSNPFEDSEDGALMGNTNYVPRAYNDALLINEHQHKGSAL